MQFTIPFKAAVAQQEILRSVYDTQPQAVYVGDLIVNGSTVRAERTSNGIVITSDTIKCNASFADYLPKWCEEYIPADATN